MVGRALVLVVIAGFRISRILGVMTGLLGMTPGIFGSARILGCVGVVASRMMVITTLCRTRGMPVGLFRMLGTGVRPGMIVIRMMGITIRV